MIDISTLNEESKQREVVYRSFGKREYGQITSWNDRFIFVRYHLVIEDNGNRRPRFGHTSEATDPRDLEFTGRTDR